MKLRLDELLVERGLFPTRAKARAAVMAGLVRVPGRDRPKAGMELAPDCAVEVAARANPYVSRGGLKLAAALERFAVPAAGRTALDVGASTGGFTDCLLQAGARLVYAVDVGTGQLDAGLRRDPRVVCMERLHARALRPAMFDPRPDLAAVDVSFISLAKVLPWVVPCLERPADILALVKPQFEVGPKAAPKGVVRAQESRDQAVAKVAAAAEALGLRKLGVMESPVRGAKGNLEYLLLLRWESA